MIAVEQPSVAVERGDIIRVVAENPDLSAYGWRFRTGSLWNDGDAFARHREQMLSQDFEQQVRASLAYLGTRRIPTKVGSYGAKHLVERWAGRYVSNGALIVAAILAGYRVVRDDNSPNCGFSAARNTG